MRIITGLLAGALIAGCSIPAMAQTNGWYTGAETGVNLVPDMKLKADGASAKAKFDPGFGVIGQFGYGFGAVRAEGELGWRYNSFDKINGVDVKGSATPVTAMANVYYDFINSSAFTPYIGAGVGGADIMVGKVKNYAGFAKLDDGLALAYQGIVGVSYALNDALSIKGDYRYLGTTDTKFKDPADGVKVKGQYDAHAIMVGFTYKFGAPAAAPAPAPMPVAAATPAPAPRPMTQAAIAKQYQVFFDFNKSDITPEANSIIQQAAASASSQNATSISLVGHTDTVGSDKYNMALSLRRANAVKAVLVKLGIPANEISVVGKGKADLLVATKDGVREPQNRRVQIILP